MSNFEQLASWIQSQHLSADGIGAHRAAFETHTAHLLHVSDFLREDVATRISRFLSQEGVKPILS